MTSTITVAFLNATFTAPTAAISITGGTFTLTNSQSFDFQGTFSFNALGISADAVSFNVSAGASVSGTIAIPVSAASPGGAPSIAVSNFSGAAQLSWLTTTGPQFQTVVPGDPILLTDFVG